MPRLFSTQFERRSDSQAVERARLCVASVVSIVSIVSAASFPRCCAAQSRFARAAVLASLIAASVAPRASADAPAFYQLISQHSDVALVLDVAPRSHLTLHFRGIEAELMQSASGAQAPQVSVLVDATSVDADVPFVARIAKSRAVLDVHRYPGIRFVSTRVIRTGIDSWLMTGDLTIRSTTRPVIIDIALEPSPHNTATTAHLLSFSAQGHFSRSAFGLSRWPATIADDVRISIRAEFVKVPARH